VLRCYHIRRLFIPIPRYHHSHILTYTIHSIQCWPLLPTYVLGRHTTVTFSILWCDTGATLPPTCSGCYHCSGDIDATCLYTTTVRCLVIRPHTVSTLTDTWCCTFWWPFLSRHFYRCISFRLPQPIPFLRWSDTFRYVYHSVHILLLIPKFPHSPLTHLFICLFHLHSVIPFTYSVCSCSSVPNYSLFPLPVTFRFCIHCCDGIHSRWYISILILIPIYDANLRCWYLLTFVFLRWWHFLLMIFCLRVDRSTTTAFTSTVIPLFWKFCSFIPLLIPVLVTLFPDSTLPILRSVFTVLLMIHSMRSICDTTIHSIHRWRHSDTHLLFYSYIYSLILYVIYISIPFPIPVYFILTFVPFATVMTYICSLRSILPIPFILLFLPITTLLLLLFDTTIHSTIYKLISVVHSHLFCFLLLTVYDIYSLMMTLPFWSTHSVVHSHSTFVLIPRLFDTFILHSLMIDSSVDSIPFLYHSFDDSVITIWCWWYNSFYSF